MPSPMMTGVAALGDGLAERHEREHAAFALVVGAQQDEHVFQRDDEQQRPDDQRQHAEHGLAAGKARRLRGVHGFPERVQRARADVAVDDADRADDERRKFLVGDAVRRTLVGALRHRLRLCHVGTSH